MFDEESSRFLKIWPAFVNNLVSHAKKNYKSPAFLNFFAIEAGKYLQNL
jgi:hypothetical protein